MLYKLVYQLPSDPATKQLRIGVQLLRYITCVKLCILWTIKLQGTNFPCAVNATLVSGW